MLLQQLHRLGSFRQTSVNNLEHNSKNTQYYHNKQHCYYDDNILHNKVNNINKKQIPNTNNITTNGISTTSITQLLENTD
jgi:hypothetical protein